MGFNSCGVLGATSDWRTLTIPVPDERPIAVQWNVSDSDYDELRHYLLIRLVRGTNAFESDYQTRAAKVYPEQTITLVKLDPLPAPEPGELTYIQMKRWYYYRSFSHLSEPSHTIEALYYDP